MPSIYSNCIAIDLPPYVETLARRVVVARRNPTIPKSQRAFAEARDYLLHRRIEVPHWRVWSSPRPGSGRTMCDGIVRHSRWGPPPPMPTMAEIDALFAGRTREPKPAPQPVVEPLPPKPRKPRKPSKPRPPSPPPPPPPPPSDPLVDACFLLYDPDRQRVVTGPDLVRLAIAAQRDGFTSTSVFVAKGRHPIVLHPRQLGFDPDRWVLNTGRYDIAELLRDADLRQFLASVA